MATTREPTSSHRPTWDHGPHRLIHAHPRRPKPCLAPNPCAPRNTHRAVPPPERRPAPIPSVSMPMHATRPRVRPPRHPSIRTPRTLGAAPIKAQATAARLPFLHDPPLLSAHNAAGASPYHVVPCHHAHDPLTILAPFCCSSPPWPRSKPTTPPVSHRAMPPCHLTALLADSPLPRPLPFFLARAMAALYRTPPP